MTVTLQVTPPATRQLAPRNVFRQECASYLRSREGIAHFGVICTCMIVATGMGFAGISTILIDPNMDKNLTSGLQDPARKTAIGVGFNVVAAIAGIAGVFFATRACGAVRRLAHAREYDHLVADINSEVGNGI